MSDPTEPTLVWFWTQEPSPSQPPRRCGILRTPHTYDPAADALVPGCLWIGADHVAQRTQPDRTLTAQPVAVIFFAGQAWITLELATMVAHQLPNAGDVLEGLHYAELRGLELLAEVDAGRAPDREGLPLDDDEDKS